MKVCKFGGTSLADADAIERVCDIIKMDSERRIVVVSAPGKRNPDDIKVTDMLLDCAAERLAGGDVSSKTALVVQRFADIQRALGLPEAVVLQIAAQLDSVIQGPCENESRYLDSVKAAGEDNCARLVAEALCCRGVRAIYADPREAGMLLNSEYGRARVLPEAYSRLSALRDVPEVVVFPGFFGVDCDGHVVTFSRGGSDITGSILAAAVKAELYENFTDVDCVFAADPRVVEGVESIPELTYREMRELAYAGFGVLHDEAIIPAVKAKIPICIRNTRNPDGAGTMIVTKHRVAAQRVVGIASSPGFCIIYLSKYLMNREIGFGRRLLQILEEEAISYEHTPTGIDNISIVLEERQLTPEKEAHITERILTELAVNEVQVERDLSLVMIVGEGMHYEVGLAAKATGALGGANVNIEMLNQGASEISVMFGIKSVDREKAVRALYDAFFKDKADEK